MSSANRPSTKSMFLKRYKRPRVPGTRPGVINISPDAIEPTIQVASFDSTDLEELADCTWEDAVALRGKRRVTWIDIVGMKDETLFERVGTTLGIHRLALEDVVNIPQRAKVEDYQDHIFLVFQFPRYGKKHTLEQVSIFAGEDFVLTWRDRPDDCFTTIRHRMQFTGRAMRDSGTDYLLYSLLDVLIDRYYPTLESIEKAIDVLDSELERGLSRPLVLRLHGLRHDIRLLKRAIWPLREAIDHLASRHAWLITSETSLYLRDCRDHVFQILDLLENYRDSCSDLRDFYATEVSNRMNGIMKFLTMISTIFIPLSFLAGLYGMNFDPRASPWNMPELRSRFGYPVLLLIMVAIFLLQIGFFRWKGWLGPLFKRNSTGKRLPPP